MNYSECFRCLIDSAIWHVMRIIKTMAPFQYHWKPVCEACLKHLLTYPNAYGHLIYQDLYEL